jgi:hypothetical protein
LRERQGDCSSAGADAGAVEDVLHVLGHSRRRDEQDPRDVGVAAALGHELQNFPFPAAQVWDSLAAALGVEIHLVQVRP